MKEKTDLRQALSYIDPAALSYQEWVSVGMGLKEAGYTPEDWEQWSARDSRRYHPGECQRKWESFHGAANPVTGGTIVRMAKSCGWEPQLSGCGWEPQLSGCGWEPQLSGRGWEPNHKEGRGLDWEEEIGSSAGLPDSARDSEEELISYLEALFEPEDYVGYVTKSYEKDGRHIPSKGCYDRTAGRLIEELRRCNGDIGRVLGDCSPGAGAWIRFNPLDGKGVKNENVTRFRYALVESDSIPIERQMAIITKLELPVAALVHSGGKSLHAVVRVEAESYEEYRERVDWLYSVCKKHGLEPDCQNRNPSRLSRMPGVMRGENRQFLVAANIGKASWSQWKEWIESAEDGLPGIEKELDTGLPELAPELIGGVLRQGHKMLLAGPSKAGKSYALIELAVSIAEGLSWLGFPCAQGRVLYVNLELDRASCLHRFQDVRKALGVPMAHQVDIWNLRGHSVPMDELAPKLIRRAKKKAYTAVIIDPIYKVITGDENSADQMANFCNQFDKVCTELGTAVIYCHHHSKGAQGGKRSMDRASGSGVFARDPDALLDLIELDLTEELLNRVNQENPETQPPTGWRVEGTLREFPKFPQRDIWFGYPLHWVDREGLLKGCKPWNGLTPYNHLRCSPQQKASRQQQRRQSVELAYEACAARGEVTVEAMCGYLGVTEKTVRRRLKEHGGFTVGARGRVEKQ